MPASSSDQAMYPLEHSGSVIHVCSAGRLREKLPLPSRVPSSQLRVRSIICVSTA